MKKIFFVLLTSLVSAAMLSSMTKTETVTEPEVLSLYCYDSFASDWGPGPILAAAFEEQTGIKVEMIAPGDAVTLLNQLILEKENPRADLVIGLDNNLTDRVLEADILIPYNSPMLEGIRPELILDESLHLLPYDWGFFAICYDSETLEEKPASLEDLTDPRYKDSLILMDPRTSTPGVGFFLWVQEVYGDDWQEYWQRLQPNILTISESWSTAYGLFTAGEAPMVLSYSSSPAYHVEYEGSTRYQSLIFSEGHPVQVEGAGIVKGTDQEELAQQFIDFLLSEESQKTLALTNIMFPVKEETPLPASFDYALKADIILSTDAWAEAELHQESIEEWLEILAQ